MGQLAVLRKSTRHRGSGVSSDPPRLLRFRLILLGDVGPTNRRLASPVTASMVGHVTAIAALVVAPLLFSEAQLPDPAGVVRAFFVAPEPVAPPPPPPPPAPKRKRANKPRPQPRVKKAGPVAEAPPRFVAPISIPEELPLEEEFEIGIDYGVEGGVEGGVPGGVIGGVIGGLPDAPPLTARELVRIGGAIKQPKLVKKVSPQYPLLAQLARVSGIVIIEAHVGVDGRVKNARVLRGPALLNEPALEAVGQWRYAPLLLNGIPTEFLLTVVVTFRLDPAGSPAPPRPSSHAPSGSGPLPARASGG